MVTLHLYFLRLREKKIALFESECLKEGMMRCNDFLFFVFILIYALVCLFYFLYLVLPLECRYLRIFPSSPGGYVYFSSKCTGSCPLHWQELRTLFFIFVHYALPDIMPHLPITSLTKERCGCFPTFYSVYLFFRLFSHYMPRYFSSIVFHF